jgi:hypothetical protein
LIEVDAATAGRVRRLLDRGPAAACETDVGAEPVVAELM